MGRPAFFPCNRSVVNMGGSFAQVACLLCCRSRARSSDRSIDRSVVSSQTAIALVGHQPRSFCIRLPSSAISLSVAVVAFRRRVCILIPIGFD